MVWMTLLVVVFLAWDLAQIRKKELPLKFSEFMTLLESGQVTDVTITGNEIKGHSTNWQLFKTFAPSGYDKLVDTLLAKKVAVNYRSVWVNMLISWAPFILLVGFWIFFMWQMQTGLTNRSADDFARLLAQLA
jgi:cell division protease FtsH